MLIGSQTNPFDLNATELHVWYFDLRQGTADLLKRLEHTLTRAELQKARRFLYPAHQERSIYARGFLRELLGHYLSKAPKDLELSENAYGKPELLDRELQFNLSHSGDWIVYAFAQCDVGIDVECCEDKSDYLALTRHFASDLEIATLAQADALMQKEMFYRLWCAKEAVIKALGRGFYADTRQFSIECRLSEPLAIVETAENMGLPASWFLQQFTPSAGVTACVACKNASVEVYSFDVASICMASSTLSQCV